MWIWLKKLFGQKVVLPDAPIEEKEPSPVVVPAPKPDPVIREEAFSHLDPDHAVPSAPLKTLLDYYSNHSVDNRGYIGVLDFTQHSSKKRFHLIDMVTGKVESHCVAHGSNSDPDNDGYPTRFSNQEGSHQSSLGIYKVTKPYSSGKFKYACRLVGLSVTNSNAFDRAVVLHSSDYVRDGASKQGRSWGCPAMQEKWAKHYIEKLKGGGLFIAWYV